MRSLETVAKASEPHRFMPDEKSLALDRYERQDEPQIPCLRCGKRKPKGIEVHGKLGTDIYVCDDCTCKLLYMAYGGGKVRKR